MTDTTDTDTRTFGEWLRDYVNDAENIAQRSDWWDRQHLGERQGMVTAAREILERYEQAQADEQERT